MTRTQFISKQKAVEHDLRNLWFIPWGIVFAIALTAVGCRNEMTHTVVNPEATDAQNSLTNSLQTLRRPINPEAVGIFPQMEPTEEQDVKLSKQAWDAFRAIFGESLPNTVTSEEAPAGWFSKDGKLRQLRAGFKIPRQEFHKRFPAKYWQEISIPEEYYESMHMPHNTPKDYMTCYVGQVEGKPAYVLWSDYGEALLLVFDP